MQVLSFFKTPLSKTLFVFVFLIVSTNLHAMRYIDSITLADGSPLTTISAGVPTQIQIKVRTDNKTSVALAEGSLSVYKDYRAVQYQIGNETQRCVTLTNQHIGVAGSFTDIITITSDNNYLYPNTQLPETGIINQNINITFRAYSTSNCAIANIDAGPSYPATVLSNITLNNKYPLNFSPGIWNATKKLDLSCDYLYVAADSVHRMSKEQIANSPTTSGSRALMDALYRANSSTPFYYGNTDQGAVFRTMSIGPYGSQDGELAVFHWWWENYSADIASNSTKLIDDTTYRYYHGRPAYAMNGDSRMAYMTPMPHINLVTYGAIGWSGAEVNQMSGEIYFSGREDGRLCRYGSSTTNSCNEGGNYQFMIYNPLTKEATMSGLVRPATISDSTGREHSSDMAIDAEGNFYIISDGVGSRTLDILKVTPGAPGEWRYSKVLTTKALASGGGMGDKWGVSFFNGKLYVSVNRYLHEIDPLTGNTRYVGDMQHTDNSVRYDVKDLASCHVATVVRGKLFIDKNGNSIRDNDETEGLRGVTVQVYDGNENYLGNQTTNALGEYSFLLPSSNANFYIRVKQPQIYTSFNSTTGAGIANDQTINLHQTWSSGGWSNFNGTINPGNNTATPYCHNGFNPETDKNNVVNTVASPYPNQNSHYYTRVCDGARADGVDTSMNVLSSANYYTKIEVRTDRAVTTADFGFGLADRSDAPSRFKDVSHTVKQGSVYLGKGVTLDGQSLLGDNADLDDLDDGIMVKNANNASEDFKDLQNYQFENRQTYTFRVYPNSTVDGKIGYLHGWMSLNKAINNTTSDFDMGLKITDEAKVDNETVGFPNGIPLTVGLQPTTGELYYDFNYTVPDKTIANASANLGGNKSQAFFRFRFLPNETPNLNATNPPANSTLADTQPWVAEGEVEDYKIVYFYNFTPPLVGNVTIYNSDGSKNLYSRVANSTFNVKVVYLDKDGKEAQPPAGQDLRADIKFEPDGSSPIDIVSGFKVTNKENELSINNLNIATRSGKFKIEYYLTSNSGTKKPSESTTFGIRPDKFTLQGIGTAKLIGGKYEDIEIVAAKYNSTDATPGYNQAYNNISESLALVDCAKDVDKVEFITSGLGIFAGGSIKGNIKYNNVGKLNIKLTDSDWLNNDKDKKLCIEGDFTTNSGDGKIGCDIVLNEKTIEFVPEQFKGSLTLRNINSGEFTYISNNTRVNEAMYATANVNIKALIAGGGTATNYDKECYANDVNWTLRLTNSKVTNTAISFYRVDTKKADIINANGSSVSSIQNQEVAVKTNANNFENGIANNIQVGFNFERLHNTPQNPFEANVGDFNITEIKDSSTVDSTSSSDTSSVLFIYGRVHSENYSNYSPITAILAFEGYCDNSCNVANYPPLSSTLRTKQWYRIMSHNGAIFGSVTELVQTKTGITINPTTVTGANGVGTSILACDDDHHSDDIKVHTQSWLLYNESNKFVDYNQFKIQFIGSGGSWAGVGQVSDDDTTGRVVPSGASERVRNKIGW